MASLSFQPALLVLAQPAPTGTPIGAASPPPAATGQPQVPVYTGTKPLPETCEYKFSWTSISRWCDPFLPNYGSVECSHNCQNYPTDVVELALRPATPTPNPGALRTRSFVIFPGQKTPQELLDWQFQVGPGGVLSVRGPIASLLHQTTLSNGKYHFIFLISREKGQTDLTVTPFPTATILINLLKDQISKGRGSLLQVKVLEMEIGTNFPRLAEGSRTPGSPPATKDMLSDQKALEFLQGLQTSQSQQK